MLESSRLYDRYQLITTMCKYSVVNRFIERLLRQKLAGSKLLKVPLHNAVEAGRGAMVTKTRKVRLGVSFNKLIQLRACREVEHFYRTSRVCRLCKLILYAARNNEQSCESDQRGLEKAALLCVYAALYDWLKLFKKPKAQLCLLSDEHLKLPSSAHR